MKLNDKLYNFLKWFCLIATDAICALIVTLSSLWHWQIPTEAIVGTITAVSTFIGVLIGLSTYKYNKDKKEVE